MAAYRLWATAALAVVSLGAAVLFGTRGWAPAYFLVMGHETDGTITQMTSEKAAGVLRRPAAVWRTEYEFAGPDGALIAGVDRVPVPSELKPGGAVRVAYLPGPGGRSMIVRDGSRTVLWCFGFFTVLSVGAAAVTVTQLMKWYRGASRPEQLLTLA